MTAMRPEPLADAARELKERLVELLETLSSLREVAALDAEAMDDRTLVRRALAILLGARDFERCSILLLEAGRLVNVGGLDCTQLYAPEIEDGPPVRPAPATFRLGEGIAGRAAASGELQHCRDTSRDPLFAARGDAPREGGARSLISCPIFAGTTLLGVLNLSHPAPDHFSEWHERLAQVFAAVLGHLLMSHRLLRSREEELQRRTRQLQQALAEAERLKERFEELSVVDELTNLHNRRFFFPQAQAVVARAARRGEPVSIVLFDLDRFKAINDQYGHQTGDRVLQMVAVCLREEVRDGDVLARFGGEEFVLALPDTPAEGAMVLARRIQASLARTPIVSGEHTIHVTASAGVAAHEGVVEMRAAELLDRLIARADAALYESKGKGGNCITIADANSK
jgi:diguanylate cyclase (GGDEF)-like protein